MPDKLSHYKFKKFATEALKNGIRLHFDSILLFKNKSYPTSFQISTIALEEIAKAFWIEHYYYSSITNTGLPEKDFEQKWLQKLYYHVDKQKSFFANEMLFYSPSFIEFILKGKLEIKKQKATYVGFDKSYKKVHIDGRISIPNHIKEKEPKKMISLLNSILKEVCKTKLYQDDFFGIEEMDKLINKSLFHRLSNWKFNSRLRSNKWIKEWRMKTTA